MKKMRWNDMDAIVSTTWLNEQLKKEQNNLRIVDVRSDLMDPSIGRKEYEKGHIPNAIFVDLKKHLSDTPGKHGGRNPLPSKEKLAETFSELGIGDNDKVIIYDDDGGSYAARMWWSLKYLGHNDAAILDGGYSKWVKDGFEVSTEEPSVNEATFTISPNEEWQAVGAHEVKEKMNDPNTIIIDSRDRKRYLGLHEPVDPKAGHIPSAVNYFWKQVLTDDGLWKSEEELKQHFSDIPKDKEVIVYCGSGVSACPNILALKKIGYKNVKLYPGSWSDWITYDHFPIATEEN